MTWVMRYRDWTVTYNQKRGSGIRLPVDQAQQLFGENVKSLPHQKRTTMHTAAASSLYQFEKSKRDNYTFHPLRALISWSARQEDARILWSVIAITSLGCVFAPVTTLLACLSGIGVSAIMVAMVSMVISLVANLAALPTRLTIPLFLLSVGMDAAIVIWALLAGCHFENIFVSY